MYYCIICNICKNDNFVNKFNTVIDEDLSVHHLTAHAFLKANNASTIVDQHHEKQTWIICEAIQPLDKHSTSPSVLLLQPTDYIQIVKLKM